MNTRRTLLLVASHGAFAVTGFAAGVYALPILIAPPAPTGEELKAATSEVQFTGTFKRDLKDCQRPAYTGHSRAGINRPGLTWRRQVGVGIYRPACSRHISAKPQSA